MGNLSPSTFNILNTQTVDLSTTIANAYWRIKTGAGSITGTGSTRTFNPSAEGSVEVEAFESFWESVASSWEIQSDNRLKVVNTSGGQSAICNPRLSQSGDTFSFYASTKFSVNIRNNLTSSKIVFLNSLGVYEYDNAGAGWQSIGHIEGDKITFRVKSDSKVEVLVNDSLAFTSNSAVTLNWSILINRQTANLNDIIEIPMVSGSGISNWGFESSTGVVGNPPLSVFTVSALVKAGDNVIPDNQSTNATSWKWLINGVQRETAFEPNLTKWMLDGKNTIELVALSGVFEHSSSKTLYVSKKYIKKSSLSHLESGLQSGVELVGRCRAIDSNGKESGWTNSEEATAT